MNQFHSLRDSSSSEEEEEIKSPPTKLPSSSLSPSDPVDASWAKVETPSARRNKPLGQVCCVCQLETTKSTSSVWPCHSCPLSSERAHKQCLKSIQTCPKCQSPLFGLAQAASTTTATQAAEYDADYSPTKEYNRNKKSNNLKAVRKREYSSQKRGAQSTASKASSSFQAADDDYE
ncbi:hypothetical protein BASA81_004820 [Batrachochytrium salamandrivorans]|nr:hypothetical protein BASA81_004820 [Batrachochytrium salamandrivorans]